jgi:hypothetical protein
MNLSAGVTTQLVNSVVAAQKQLKGGGDICPNLAALTSQVASFVPKKVSTAQQAALDSSISAIQTELGC